MSRKFFVCLFRSKSTEQNEQQQQIDRIEIKVDVTFSKIEKIEKNRQMLQRRTRARFNCSILFILQLQPATSGANLKKFENRRRVNVVVFCVARERGWEKQERKNLIKY